MDLMPDRMGFFAHENSVISELEADHKMDKKLKIALTNQDLAERKMEKKLSEMSLEELWKLFPVYLTEHQPYWKEWYTDEENFLKNRVPKIERISHIGSTAISSIHAKPIIDILAEASKDYKLSDYKEVIVKSDYVCMYETSDRISFNKGLCKFSIKYFFENKEKPRI